MITALHKQQLSVRNNILISLIYVVKGCYQLNILSVLFSLCSWDDGFDPRTLLTHSKSIPGVYPEKIRLS
jgi:hypothetical protein